LTATWVRTPRPDSFIALQQKRGFGRFYGLVVALTNTDTNSGHPDIKKKVNDGNRAFKDPEEDSRASLFKPPSSLCLILPVRLDVSHFCI
jgi:hypothetical protein